MSGLAWLNDLMVWMGRWFPRLILIRAVHSGVKFGLGGSVEELQPGLHWYWPITTEVTVVSKRMRTLEIASMLCDREVVSVAVQFSIEQPKQLLMTFQDIFSYVDDKTQAALSKAYVAELSNELIEAGVFESLNKAFSPVVSIHGVSVVSRGRVFALKNLNDWAVHAKTEL